MNETVTYECCGEPTGPEVRTNHICGTSGAETLRRAAALMRERAEAADEGPWVAPAQSSHADWHGLQNAYFALGNVFIKANAEHIASWHPAVALAVADWLDDLAARITLTRQLRHEDEERQALAVARAYLGSDQ